MIHIVLGTKAQLIKMAPIMRRLNERGIEYNYVSTGQHRGTVAEIHENFGIRPPDIRLYDGPDILSVPSMLAWGTRILVQTRKGRNRVFRGDRNAMVLVHGDTASTLQGAVLARVAGAKVGHVESGLRSFNPLQPFPEELIRLATFQIANYYFCPGEWAISNVRHYPGVKVDTGSNTLIDALNIARPFLDQASIDPLPSTKFGIVTLHRYENIRTYQSLSRLVAAVLQIARVHKLLFILHPPTELKLKRHGFYDRLSASPNIELRPRYDYFDFIRLLRLAEFVVSDGGSNQEECAYLGKPVLLLREVTERQEGLGKSVVLSRFDRYVIQDFCSHYQQLSTPPTSPRSSPGDMIIDACAAFV